MENLEKIRAFIEKRAAGLSLAAIARDLKIGRDTARKWEREMEREIAESRADQWEDLARMYRVTADLKVERLSTLLSRIDEALDKADFTEVPVDKLLVMRACYADKLEAAFPAAAKGRKVDTCRPDDLEALTDLIDQNRATVAQMEEAAEIKRRSKIAKDQFKDSAFDDLFENY